MIGFIGGGNMAEAIVKGLIGNARLGGSSAAAWFDIQDIVVAEPREDRRTYLGQSYGVRTTGSNKEAASSSDIIILAVKPQNIDAVLEEIKDSAAGKMVISIAAGITLPYLQAKLKTTRLVRVMPNTPAIIGEGMSVMSLCEGFPEEDVAAVSGILASMGKVLIMPEKHMNIVTALSGSGPAFIALFVEAMIEGGVEYGLGRGQASQLAVQTLLGTARLLDSGLSPDKLREMVTSPGGTTAAGLEVFKEKGLVDIVDDALHAATKRAEELGRRE